jgi:hypothetical protein
VANQTWDTPFQTPSNRVKETAKKNYQLWQENPSHPSLEFKKVNAKLNCLRHSACVICELMVCSSPHSLNGIGIKGRIGTCDRQRVRHRLGNQHAVKGIAMMER